MGILKSGRCLNPLCPLDLPRSRRIRLVPREECFPTHPHVDTVLVRDVEHRPRELPANRARRLGHLWASANLEVAGPVRARLALDCSVRMVRPVPVYLAPGREQVVWIIVGSREGGIDTRLEAALPAPEGTAVLLDAKRVPLLPARMIGTDPGRRHDVLPLDAVRALLVLPGPEVTRLAVDVSAGTALANVRAPQ